MTAAKRDRPAMEGNSMDQTRAKIVSKFIAPIDPVELALRMIEAGHGLPRPAGSPRKVFQLLFQEDQELWMRVSEAALAYISECIADSQQVS